MIPRGSEDRLGSRAGRRDRRAPRYVTEAEALDHVAGYVLINDVSERAFQIERGGTWDKGKGCDTFGPSAPGWSPATKSATRRILGMWLDVNGQRKQDGSSKTMIFPISKLVSYISEFMTLEPGDLITTGTPPGVGMGQKPEPVYLKAGDVIISASRSWANNARSSSPGPRKASREHSYADRFAGRCAVVTGGASGLGKAVAARIVAEGGKVALWDLDAEGLEAAAAEVGAAHTVALDVSDQTAVAAAAKASNEALGKIDILVASAGITGATVPVHEFPSTAGSG
jgi:hypothetical protein